MNFEFSNDELSVILVSLVGRKHNIRGLLDIEGMSSTYYNGYRQEMNVVDNLLERFFPGSVERINATIAA